MLENIKIKWRKFCQGRNGVDELAEVIFGVSVFVCILNLFMNKIELVVISIAICMYAVFRTLSKSKQSRYLENEKFLGKVEYIKLKFKKDKHYKIFTCKRCGRRIRVPRGKKRIEVTCPVCGNKSKHYT